MLPYDVSSVTIVCKPKDVLRFELNLSLLQRRLMPVSGITKVLTNVPFQVLSTHVCKQPRHISKHILFGHLCDNMIATVEVCRVTATGTKPTNTTMNFYTVQDSKQGSSLRNMPAAKMPSKNQPASQNIISHTRKNSIECKTYLIQCRIDT